MYLEMELTTYLMNNNCLSFRKNHLVTNTLLKNKTKLNFYPTNEKGPCPLLNLYCYIYQEGLCGIHILELQMHCRGYLSCMPWDFLLGKIQVQYNGSCLFQYLKFLKLIKLNNLMNELLNIIIINWYYKYTV